MAGIKGIANYHKALDKYFLTIGEMSNIIANFFETSKLMLERKNKMSIMKFLAQKIKESPAMWKRLLLFLKCMVQHSIVLKTCLT